MRKSKEYYKAQLRQIDSSDGISKNEAIIIAQNYVIEEKMDHLCALSRPRVEKSRLLNDCWTVFFKARWLVRLDQGLTGVEVDIDMKTGQVKTSSVTPY